MCFFPTEASDYIEENFIGKRFWHFIWTYIRVLSTWINKVLRAIRRDKQFLVLLTLIKYQFCKCWGSFKLANNCDCSTVSGWAVWSTWEKKKCIEDSMILHLIECTTYWLSPHRFGNENKIAKKDCLLNINFQSVNCTNRLNVY